MRGWTNKDEEELKALTARKNDVNGRLVSQIANVVSGWKGLDTGTHEYITGRIIDSGQRLLDVLIEFYEPSPKAALHEIIAEKPTEFDYSAVPAERMRGIQISNQVDIDKIRDDKPSEGWASAGYQMPLTKAEKIEWLVTVTTYQRSTYEGLSDESINAEYLRWFGPATPAPVMPPPVMPHECNFYPRKMGDGTIQSLCAFCNKLAP